MGELFTLSCVYIDNNRIIVGSEALNAGLLDPSRFVQNWKRAMGTDKVLATVDGKAYLAKDIARVLLEHVANGSMIRRLLDPDLMTPEESWAEIGLILARARDRLRDSRKKAQNGLAETSQSERPCTCPVDTTGTDRPNRKRRVA